uniref:Uncharacterized protein n=1 Tax=Onchocerca volvulus TaxID=6282 RepID=A0A8R1Y5D0_ONCVO
MIQMTTKIDEHSHQYSTCACFVGGKIVKRGNISTSSSIISTDLYINIVVKQNKLVMPWPALFALGVFCGVFFGAKTIIMKSLLRRFLIKN